MAEEAEMASDGMVNAACVPRMAACARCGQLQWLPEAKRCDGARAGRGDVHCARCGASMADSRDDGARRRVRAAWTVSLTLSALILYPLAMALPIMRIERFGHGHDTTIWGGVVSLVEDGHTVMGLIVLACSVLVPLMKLGAMLVLSMPRLAERRFTAAHRHATYRLVEFLGRWGMLDVLLVAVLIAAIKLGDLMSVRAGPGVAAFGAMVLLSLGASACFDAKAIWSERREGDGEECAHGG